MEIVYKKIEDIKEYDNNPRRNSKAVLKVAESIKNFGFLNPIVIDNDNFIVSGHTRLKAARMLKLEEVPCIVKNLSAEEARLVRIVDNKSHEYATWDIEKMHKELGNINLNYKSTFFTLNRDRKFFAENKFLIFGKCELPITDEEYDCLKKVYDQYIEHNKTYLGFVMYLTGGENNGNS